jgi:hypothetical protein
MGMGMGMELGLRMQVWWYNATGSDAYRFRPPDAGHELPLQYRWAAQSGAARQAVTLYPLLAPSSGVLLEALELTLAADGLAVQATGVQLAAPGQVQTGELREEQRGEHAKREGNKEVHQKRT